MLNMSKILLIDDDRKLGEVLSEYLAQHQLSLAHELHPQKGIDRLAQDSHALVILDIMMPEIDGFEVCRRIRKNSDVPIIMLTARGEAMDRVIGLELGADDYLAKPFEPRELVIRIQNILKRVAKSENILPKLEFKGLSIDTSLRRVFLNEQ